MSFTVIANTAAIPYEEWLERRKEGIGGSDAAVVCGVSRYKSPVELWMEKTGQLPAQEAGEAAYWGHQLEELVRTEFTKRTGIQVEHRMELLRSDQHSFMQANLDGTCRQPDLGPCVFEAKTVSAFKAGEWEDGIPDEYYLQVQHYMAVTGYRGAYVAALIGGNNFRWKLIHRDDELIEALIQLEADFWKHVQNETPPPLDGSNASAKFLAECFPSSLPRSTVELPGQAATLIRQYDEACEQLKAITEQKQQAENLLKQMLGEHESGTTGDHIVTWKNVTQERLDSKTLKAEHPALYKKYASKSSYRRFSVKAI